MRRHTRTNLFLLVMVVLLGIAAFAELRRESAMARDPLTTIDTDRIRTFSIECLSCTARRFEKVGDQWFMRQPKDAPASANAVARLIAIVRAPVRFRRPASEVDPSKLGLNPPLATLVVDGVPLKFGTTDAIHNDRYVEFGGTISLVPDRFSVLLFATPESELAESAAK